MNQEGSHRLIKRRGGSLCKESPHSSSSWTSSTSSFESSSSDGNYFEDNYELHVGDMEECKSSSSYYYDAEAPEDLAAAEEASSSHFEDDNDDAEEVHCLENTLFAEQFHQHNEEPFEIVFRGIHPKDRQQIQGLHEEWFPVTYQDDFYEELVHSRMAQTGDPLFTCLALRRPLREEEEDESNNNQNQTRYTNPNVLQDDAQCAVETGKVGAPHDRDDSEEIVACVVGAKVHHRILSDSTRSLLINDPYRHPRLFYIMTLGTASHCRLLGLGSCMLSKCMEEVAADTGCGVLYLHVITTNTAAIRFYEKLDFMRVKEIPDYYTIDNVNYNCYLYVRYFHGNRGHLSLFSIVSNAFSSVWRHVKVPFSYFLDYDRR